MDDSTEDQRLPHRYCGQVYTLVPGPTIQRAASIVLLLAMGLTAATVFRYRLELNEPVSLEHLKKLGVVYWKVNGEEDPKLQAIRDARGYSYKVKIGCC